MKMGEKCQTKAEPVKALFKCLTAFIYIYIFFCLFQY